MFYKFFQYNGRHKISKFQVKHKKVHFVDKKIHFLQFTDNSLLNKT